MKQVVFYGAGEWARLNLSEWESEGMIPTCFTDIDATKHFTFMTGATQTYEILPFNTALTRYPDAQIFCSVEPNTTKLFVQDYLIRECGIDAERIINYEPYSRGIFCDSLLSDCIFNNYVGYCCIRHGDNIPPFLEFSGGAETVSKFVSYRNEIMDKLNKNIDNTCSGCPSLKNELFYTNRKLRFVNFCSRDHYDRCNLSCKYCSIQTVINKKGRHYDNHGLKFENRLEISRQFIENGLIDDNTCIVLSCGNPSIHPRLDEMLELFQNYRMRFQDNATVYCQSFADKIRDGRSSLQISIDCGTRETYNRLKGVDAFDKVLSNCRKYAADGDVFLYYVVMDGENTSEADAIGFVEFCREVRPARVRMVNDLFDEKTPLSKQTESLINSVKLGCCENNLSCVIDRSLERESYFD